MIRKTLPLLLVFNSIVFANQCPFAILEKARANGNAPENTRGVAASPPAVVTIPAGSYLVHQQGGAWTSMAFYVPSPPSGAPGPPEYKVYSVYIADGQPISMTRAKQADLPANAVKLDHTQTLMFAMDERDPGRDVEDPKNPANSKYDEPTTQLTWFVPDGKGQFLVRTFLGEDGKPVVADERVQKPGPVTRKSIQELNQAAGRK